MQSKLILCLNLLCLTCLLHAQSWHALGEGLNGPVYEIFIHEDDVYVGGDFQNAGEHPDADFLARWDGCDWHPVAPGLNNSIHAIAIVSDRVYVSGNYPNPTADKLSIDWHDGQPSDLPVAITDISGYTLIHKSTAREIDISSLPPGLYYCTILHDGHAWRGKFVKM